MPENIGDLKFQQSKFVVPNLGLEKLWSLGLDRENQPSSYVYFLLATPRHMIPFMAGSLITYCCQPNHGAQLFIWEHKVRRLSVSCIYWLPDV
jgi:hypothetical protein